MYMQSQKQLMNFLDKLSVHMQSIEIPTDKINALSESIRTKELLIPVIGSFSAGKSTLLNTFLDREALPTSINPETDLAAELRYNTEEFIEAFRLKDGSVTRFELTEFDQIKAHAQNFSHLKIHLKNEQLARIEPLILVDMPGFGSSLANHNKAINHYLPKGAHFVVVTSAEEGNITQSMMRQLSELDNVGRDFHILLSKANLRSPDQVAKLKAYIADQIELGFQSSHNIIAVGKNDKDELNKVFNSIDPDKIIENNFKDMVKDAANEIIDHIHIEINALKNNTELNQDTITKLNQAVMDIENQKARMIDQIKQSHGDLITKRCIDHIGAQLNNHAEELSQSLINKNHDMFNEMIVTIIRDGLSFKLSREFQLLSSEIVKYFEKETLGKLEDSIREFGMNEQWLAEFSDKINKAAMITGNIVDGIQNHLNKGNSKAGSVYRTIASVLAISTNIVGFAVELALVFLPDILNFFGTHIQNQKIKQVVSSEIIPKIKMELSKHLSTAINEQIQAMVENVSVSFEEELKKKKDVIEQLEREREKNKTMIQDRLTKLQQAKTSIMSLAEKSLY